MTTTPPPTPNPVHDIAVRLYVELVARNATVVEGSVKMGASAANLATLSLKLAEAFVNVEAEAIAAAAASAPVRSTKLEDADIAGWLK